MRPSLIRSLPAPCALLPLLALLPLAACGADADSAGSTSAPGGVGLGQGGAQDFGLFRQILEAGGIPHPDTLDEIGFFAEHKLDYPPADCGEDVCMHALGGAMGNMITGSTCTVVQLGLNTPIDPATLERPPLDLVLAIDVSGSMSGGPLDAVKAGLTRMLDHLEPGDRLTLVTYSDRAEVRVTALDPIADRNALEIAIADLAPRGATNIYDGLFVAYEHAAAAVLAERETRVVLLSDGEATAGLTTPARMHALAEAYARQGIGLTTIGVGESFDVEVMRGLAEVGAGNFYFLEDPAAAREVFTEEVQTFLHPVALDVEIAFVTGPAYTARRVYGSRRFEGGQTGGLIRIPALFLAGRTSAADPIEGGRRGGGGAILVELLPRSPSALAPLQLTGDELAEVGQVTIRWTDPRTGQRRHTTTTITAPHDPNAPPADGWFTSATVEKGFVMLNIYAGSQLAAQLALDADPGAAIGVLTSLEAEVSDWLADHPDPDIADDLTYVELFIDNLQSALVTTPIATPPEPWPAD